MADPFAFTVSGLEPDDPAFHAAPATLRRRFWEACIPLVQRAYHHQLEAGIGADGEGLTHLALSTRRHRRSARTRRPDPNAPPLIPAHALSRTNSLLRGRVPDTLDHVEMYWLTDRSTGLNWGQVLAWHREGSTRYPPRDVMGLAPAFVAEARASAAHWWQVRTKVPGALPTVTPAYQPKHPEKAVPKAPKPVVQFELRGQKYTVGATLGAGPVSVKAMAEAIRKGTFSGLHRPGGLPPITPPPPPPKPRHPGLKPGTKTNEELAAEARRKAEAERKAREAAEAKAREEAARKAAEAARLKAEAEARARAEAERKAKEEAARKAAEEAARLKAEAQRKSKAVPDRVAERRARVQGRLQTLGADIARLRAEELATKAEYQRVTATSGDYDARIAARKAMFEAEDRRSAADRELAALESWEKNVRVIPTLVPPGPIGDRIRDYSEGDEKVRRVIEIGGEHQKRYDTLDAERAKLREDYKRLDREKEALLRSIAGKTSKEQAKREKELSKQLDAIVKQREDLFARQLKVRDETREAVVAVLATDRPQSFAFRSEKGTSQLGEDLLPLAQRGRDNLMTAEKFLGRLLREGEGPIGTNVAQVGPNGVQRAHQNARLDYIQVTSGSGPETPIHEIGHLLDEKLTLGGDSVVERSREFLLHRVGSEPVVKMQDVSGFNGYSPDEVGRKDRFDEVFGPTEAYYVGKDYGSRATEILSMGLQKLYEDPVLFASKDPEYFKYIIGILDGSLR